MAIIQMKDKKAECVDGIPAELLKGLGNKAMKELINLSKEMYEKGEWSNDFTKAIILALQKKSNAIECTDHCTLSLIPHASKIILKVLTKRLESKAATYISRTQFGFRKGCGTREAIAVIRTLQERCLEHDQDAYVCYVDFEKAFDRVNWKILMVTLKNIGVDWKDRRMIRNLYKQQRATVRVTDGESELAKIGQGKSVTTTIFNIRGSNDDRSNGRYR